MDKNDLKRRWRQEGKRNRPDGVCSFFPDCHKATDGVHKMCQDCRAASYIHHKARCAKPKPEGTCRASGCLKVAVTGKARCEGCAKRDARQSASIKGRGTSQKRRHRIKAEVMAAYGHTCLCCGETNLAFLSIDHIDRYDGAGPKTGSVLYAWLRAQNFPSGFRVLCINCNFALGKFGYCPHGDLTQPFKNRVPLSDRAALLKARGLACKMKNKLAAFRAYGGVFCACCEEPHHECLSIDHINNDGARHRRAICGKDRTEPKNREIYLWLKINGYPDGFQVLCLNCNNAKRTHPVCPHKIAVKAQGPGVQA